MRSQQVLLGTRIPLDLKEKLYQYCVSHGIKMSYFVSEAIKKRLLEIAEDNRDLGIARARLKSG
jgi:predicted DNA-binding protein